MDKTPHAQLNYLLMNTQENNRLTDYRTFCDRVNIISAESLSSETATFYGRKKHITLIQPPYQVIIKNLNGLINVIKESENIAVYPNQIVDHAFIELKSTALFPVKAEVREITGQIIKKVFYAHEDEMELDLSSIRLGLYEIEIMDALKTLGEIEIIKYNLTEKPNI